MAHRVVIVGGGFGGLRMARALAGHPVEVTLIDRRNFHTFQPLLYQVATAMLEPGAVARSLRSILRRQSNATVRLATVLGVDWKTHQVLVDEGDAVPFDTLVLAAGAVTSDYGIEGVEEHAFPLKTPEEALRLRGHVLERFERTDAEPARIEEGELTFVVVGGGPTGVELAGALTELFHGVLRKDFPRLAIDRAHVVLIEASDHLMDPFRQRSQEDALEALRSLGVDVRLGRAVVAVTADAVHLDNGEVIRTRCLVWTAGVRANPLADALGLAQTKGARIVVEPDLSVPGHPDAFVIGDMAAGRDGDGELYPQVAPVAEQGAHHVARQLERRRRGQPTVPFKYRNKGIMATIGRNAAVAEVPGGLRFRGRLAWIMWLALHLQRLIGYRNRIEVLTLWAWNYITYDRTARLIVGVAKAESGGTEDEPAAPAP